MRLLRSLPWLVGLLACLWLIWAQWVGVQYDTCLTEHRSGFHLDARRGTIRVACRRNLNPFSSWLDN